MLASPPNLHLFQTCMLACWSAGPQASCVCSLCKEPSDCASTAKQTCGKIKKAHKHALHHAQGRANPSRTRNANAPGGKRQHAHMPACHQRKRKPSHERHTCHMQANAPTSMQSRPGQGRQGKAARQGKQEGKFASTPAREDTSKQASTRANERASKRASKRARERASERNVKRANERASRQSAST